MSYNEFYKLTKNKRAFPCTMQEYRDNRIYILLNKLKHVGHEVIDKYLVSTIWLGLNHQYKKGAPPLILETMIFDPDFTSIYCERYSTWGQAAKGHKKAVEWLRENILNKE